MAKTYFRRLANKGKKVAKKRYVTKRGLPKVNRIVKDVARLKKLINVEKKYVEVNIGAANPIHVGQYSAIDSGSWTYGYKLKDITPAIAQGVTVNQRTGDSVKLTGCNIQLQIFQQPNLTVGNRLYVDIYKVDVPKGITDTTAKQIYQNNVFNNLIDAASNRDPDYMGVYKKIASRSYFLPANPGEGTMSVIHRTINLKLSQHLHMDGAASSIPVNCQYLMMFRASAGNVGTTTLTAGGGINQFPILTASSGIAVCDSMRWWYVDNQL